MKSQNPFKSKTLKGLVFIVTTVLMLSGCGQARYRTQGTPSPEPIGTTQNTAPSGEFSPEGTDAVPTPSQKAEICEPFKSTPVIPTSKHGLIGQYRYQDVSAGKDASTFSSLGEILKNGKPGVGTIVLTDLNFSPRKQVDSSRVIERQLVTAQDQVVSGQFLMSLKTSLALDPNEKEGFYHLGFIVNGAVEVGTWNEKEQKYNFLMKSESLEKPGFKCARNFLLMKKGSPLKVLIRYAHLNGGDVTFQAVWKKVDTEKSSLDPRCDQVKPVDYYIKKAGGGVTPSPEFLAMKKNGWKILTPENFIRDQAYAGLCVPNETKKQ